MTGVTSRIWLSEPEQYDDTDEHIASIVRRYKGHLVSFSELEFVFFHLTSSNNECLSIRNNGIKDLWNVYNTADSELRLFLQERGIELLPEYSKLIWNEEYYDIGYYGSSLLWTKKEKLANQIGYRFEKDYCVCGFLSLGPSAYATHVENNPEILLSISDLIGRDIASEWKHINKSYEVTAKVSADKIVPAGEALCYATYAYWNMFDIDQRVLLCKNGVSIPAEDIISIEPFQWWR